MPTLTVAQVNKSLRQAYGTDAKGEANVKMRRGRGYYYFTGEHGYSVESLCMYSIADVTLAWVLLHVGRSLNK